MTVRRATAVVDSPRRLGSGPFYGIPDDRARRAHVRAARRSPGSQVGATGASLAIVMGMGGAGGPRAHRRRRLTAALVVFLLVLVAGATVLSLALG